MLGTCVAKWMCVTYVFSVVHTQIAQQFAVYLTYIECSIKSNMLKTRMLLAYDVANLSTRQSTVGSNCQRRYGDANGPPQVISWRVAISMFIQYGFNQYFIILHQYLPHACDLKFSTNAAITHNYDESMISHPLVWLELQKRPFTRLCPQ